MNTRLREMRSSFEPFAQAESEVATIGSYFWDQIGSKVEVLTGTDASEQRLREIGPRGTHLPGPLSKCGRPQLLDPHARPPRSSDVPSPVLHLAPRRADRIIPSIHPSPRSRHRVLPSTA